MSEEEREEEEETRRGRRGNRMPFHVIRVYFQFGGIKMVAVHILQILPKACKTGEFLDRGTMSHCIAVSLLPLLVTTGNLKNEALLGPK